MAATPIQATSVNDGSPDLKRQVFAGSAFGAGAQLIGLGCRLAQGIVLARLLGQADFGVIAVSMALFEFVNLVQGMGLETTVVQKGAQRPGLADTAFTGQMILTVGLVTVLVFAVAPLWTALFRDSNVGQVVRVQSFLLLISASAFLPRTVLKATMRFREIALSIVAGTAASTAASIVCAYLWRNFWAVVAGMFCGQLISMIILLWQSPYRPRFKFDKTIATELFGFSKYVLMLQLVAATGYQLDKLIAGRFLSLEELGVYWQSYRWGMLAVMAAIPAVQPVFFSAYCRRKTELSSVRKAYLHSIFLLTLVLAPCAVGLWLIAPEFISKVLGEKWLPAVAPMRVLVLVSLLRMLNSLTAPLIQALGRPDLQFRAEVISKLAFVASLFGLGMRYGIAGVVAAVAIHHAVNQAVMILATKRLIHAGLPAIVRAMFVPCMLSLVMVPAWHFLASNQRGLPAFVVAVFALGAGYALAVVVAYRLTSLQRLKQLVLAPGNRTP